MKKLICSVIILTILFSLGVFAKGDLVITAGQTEVLPQTGFEQDIFIPFTITNIGDEDVTSRLGVGIKKDNEELAVAYPLYKYTGEVETEGEIFKYNQGVPIIDAKGKEYFQKAKSNDILQKGQYVATAPTITLKPKESITFTEKDRGFFNIFSVAKEGEHTFTYVIDAENEVDETDETNNEVSVKLNVKAPQVIKGPNKEFKLLEKQYWFFFKDVGDCINVKTPKSTKICLVNEGLFTAKLTINNEQVTLFHVMNIFSFDKKVANLELSVSEDGFFLAYS